MAKIPRSFIARYEFERPSLQEATWLDATRAARRPTFDETDRANIEEIFADYLLRNTSREEWASHKDVCRTLGVIERAANPGVVHSVFSSCNHRDDVLRRLRLAGLPDTCYRALSAEQVEPEMLVELSIAASTASTTIAEEFGRSGGTEKLPELYRCLSGLAWVFSTKGGKISAEKSENSAHDELIWAPFVRWSWALLQDPCIPLPLRPVSIGALGSFAERNRVFLKEASRPPFL